MKNKSYLNHSKCKLITNSGDAPRDYVRVVAIEKKYGKSRRLWLCKRIHKGEFKQAVKVMKSLQNTKGPLYIDFGAACEYVEKNYRPRYPEDESIKTNSVADFIRSQKDVAKPPADIQQVLGTAHLEHVLTVILKDILEENKITNLKLNDLCEMNDSLRELLTVWK
jgi:hypothetical protein